MKIILALFLGYALFELFKILLAFPLGALSASMNMSAEDGLMLDKVLSAFLAAGVVITGLLLSSRRKRVKIARREKPESPIR